VDFVLGKSHETVANRKGFLPQHLRKSVCHDDQGYMTPPHVNGIKKETMAAIKKVEPNQSNLRAFSSTLPGVCASLRKKMMATIPSPMMGRLIQKIQRHETRWAKAPPIKGPVTDPMAHIEPRYPNQARGCQL
jgi:hypothetical protein